ncbi:MAG: lipocalin family protein [Rikenellaceae bacterium]
MKNRDMPQVVKSFDLNRYLGKWYEIARFDVPFERGLTSVWADYSLRSDGNVNVLNTGVDKKGVRKAIVGKAKVPDKNNPAHLKVSFFWIFYSDYLVLDIDQENYSYSLVGSKKDKYLWILSRTPHLEKETIDMIIKKAQNMGYDTSKLMFTKP